MATTLKMIDKELKLCDAIIYVLDARCPKCSVNPEFVKFCDRKPVLYVLKKQDLAPGKIKKLNIVADLEKLLADKIARAKERGINRILRAVVVGVPNCGKSTLINELAKRGKTKTGDKAGITRSKQWVQIQVKRRVGHTEDGRIDDTLWLLDTPGTLWPSFKVAQVGKNLAYVGSIKDDILDIVELAKDLLSDLLKLDKGCLMNRFGADDFTGIARKRGYIVRGGGIDEKRTAVAILNDFRAGRIGKFNLDDLLL
jgi:ribosome biogenesis GTPase A